MKAEPVSMSVTFQTNKADKVAINMFLDITDRSNFIFLRKLQPLFEKIKSYGIFYINLVNLTVSYATIPCRNCPEGDCFYNKSYCKKILFGWVPDAGQIFIK